MPSEPKPARKASRNRVIAAVLHELLNEERFERESDAKEALKVRCARLRIPYDADAILDALALVERTRPITSANRRPSPPPVQRDISKPEAVEILNRLGIRLRGWQK